MVSAPFLVISFFWFAWTSFPSVSIWAPMLSGGLLGWSICLIFVCRYNLCAGLRLTTVLKLALINYIIDAYLAVAASALAIVTVVRSLFGAGFPVSEDNILPSIGSSFFAQLFATQMYDGLDPEWASSLLGFIALIMMPIPFVLSR